MDKYLTHIDICKGGISMPDTKQTLSTYRANEDKQLMKLLLRLLNWFSNKISNEDEQVIIVLSKKNPPTFYRTSSSITYVPPETTIEKVTLKTSEWTALHNMKSIKLETIKELLEEHIPGICVNIGVIEEDISALFIDWNQINLGLEDDAVPRDKEKNIPIPYRVLSFLIKQPECIVKGKKSFNCKLGMQFKEKAKVVYVGDGATYIFNENGFNYLRQTDLNEFKLNNCRDLVKIIEHHKKDPFRIQLNRKIDKYINL